MYLVCVYGTVCVCAGNVEWQDGKKDRCLVMWRTPQEWGQLIYQWVSTVVQCGLKLGLK